MNFIFLLLICETVFFFIAFITTNHDIMAPSVVMCAMFVFSTIFACLNIKKWKIEMSFETFFILTSGITIYFLTETVFRYLNLTQNHNKRYVNSQISIPTYKINIFFLGLNLFGSVWLFCEIRKITGNVSSFGEMLHLYRINNTLSNISDRQNISIILNQLLKFIKAETYVYLYVLVAKLIEKKSWKRLWLTFLVFITSMFPFVLFGARGAFIQVIVGAVTYYYILFNQKHLWKKNLSWKYIKFGFMVMAIGIPIFYYSTFWIGRIINLNLIDYISLYIGSSIQLFNLYVEKPTTAPKMFGEETFNGINRLLQKFGLKENVPSVHLEARWLNSYIKGNTYTFFRPPLHDFGIWGMYFFTILVSAFFSILYFGRIKRKCRTPKREKYTLLYGYVFYWIVYSSIAQISHDIISMTEFMTMFFIIVIYKFTTRKNGKANK